MNNINEIIYCLILAFSWFTYMWLIVNLALTIINKFNYYGIWKEHYKNFYFISNYMIKYNR